MDRGPGKVEQPVELPDYVAVPAYPAAQDGRPDIRFELRTAASGRPAGVVFTSVAKLIEQLGSSQPWMILRTSGYRELLARGDVHEMVLDPVVEPGTGHWSAEALRALGEVNDGRL